MRKLATITAALISLAAISSPAFADPARIRKVLSESIKIEEDRAREMDGMAKNDAKLAADILRLVVVRERFAAAMEAKARDMRDAAAVTQGPDQATLNNFAKEFETFAQHDRGQAEQRKQAGHILEEQARGGEEAARKHSDNVARLRERLANIH